MATAQGAPTISPADPSSLQLGIDAAYKAGEKKVVVPAGIYRLPRVNDSHWHLQFARMKDFEIDASGATFVFSGRDQRGILFDQCENVSFHGATLTREVPPFSQGKIEAIATDRKSIDVRIDKGYPTDLDDARYFPAIPVLNAYQQGTQKLKAGVPGLYTTDERRGSSGLNKNLSSATFDRLGPDLFRFHLRPVPSYVPLSVGDPVAWRGESGSEFNVWQCAGMKFEDITIKNGLGMAYAELFGAGGNQYIHCKLTYAPAPSGAVDAPLLAGGADAFNSGATKRGPTLDGCLFEGANDDDVNIHGNYGLILESHDHSVLIDGRKSHRDLIFAHAGDRLRFYDRKGALVGDAVAISVKPRPDYSPSTLFPFVSPVFVHDKAASYLEVVLDRPVAVEAWGTVANADGVGSGFAIRHGIFRNNRAHGLFIRASDGLIEGCTIEGTENAGILVAPEMTAWCNEGDYARNVTIQGNTIRNVGIGCSQPWNSGVTVEGIEFGYGGIVPLPGGHRDIVIRDNIFEDNPDTNIVVTSAINVDIEGNRFLRPMSIAPLHGADTGANPTALIWLRQASQVRLKNNTVTLPGPHLKTRVDSDSSVTVEGAEDGVAIEP